MFKIYHYIQEVMKMKTKNIAKRKNTFRLIAIIILSLFVITTGILFWINAYKKGDVAGGILGALIAITILVSIVLVFKKGNKSIREGYPLEDERSTRVKEKASSRAFYASLYLLLIVGLLSDSIIRFRDVSQAMSATVGGMAILFVAFWAYYNRKQM
jgi:uncharacterized membrane protein